MGKLRHVNAVKLSMTELLSKENLSDLSFYKLVLMATFK
jgi:hypothetical protein